MKTNERERVLKLRNTIRDGENAQCACGSSGSWADEDVIYGTSGLRGNVIWAGCPNCTGSAVGSPIEAAELDWYHAHAAVYATAIEAADVLAEARRQYPHERDCAGNLLTWPTDVTYFNFRGAHVYRIPLSSPLAGGIVVARVEATVENGEITTRLGILV